MARRAGGQELGHKTLGTLGLDAGLQPDAGLYVVDMIASYHASELIDRSGNPSPAGLGVDAVAGALGVATIVQLPMAGTFYTATLSVPAAHVSASTRSPVASIERSGVGDLYVQPVKLGWRASRYEVVTSFAFYAPTGGGAEPGGNDGIGRNQWTYELSLGGTVYFDADRTWSLSALASYDVSSRKLSLDIRRGDTLQVQGGAGKKLLRVLEVGLAGYGLWQVTDDGGADVPPALRGAREQTYGLGPEVDLAIPAIRSRLTLRCEQDFGVESRPLGRILFFDWTAFVSGLGR